MTLRVGILTYDFVPFIGGQGRVTHDLWRHLAARGDVEMTVISPSRNELPAHISQFAATRSIGGHPLFSLLSSASIARRVRDLRLDVLHVNGGPGGVLLLRDPSVPVVYSLYHTYEQVARLAGRRPWTPALLHAERSACNRAAIVTASTASTARSLQQHLRVTPPVVEIPCGVDFDALPRLDRERDPHLVLFVGRLEPRKNPQLLIRAFAKTVAARPDARLVIAGRGPLEARLRALAAELRISDRVAFAGFVSHGALVELYNRAAVVAVPSLFEGFGLSAAEAGSTGACVLATETEGLRDVVVHRETGLLAAPDPEAMADALIELLGDQRLRVALGSAAAERVRCVYRWDTVADQYATAYRRALGTHREAGHAEAA